MAGIHRTVTANHRRSTTRRGTYFPLGGWHQVSMWGLDVQEEQGFEAAIMVDELDAELEASLQTCHHMVAEYRALLIAAVRNDPWPESEKQFG